MAIRILYLHGIGEIGGAERALLSVLERLDRAYWQPVVAANFGCQRVISCRAEFHVRTVVR